MKNKVNVLRQRESVVRRVGIVSFSLMLLVGLSGCGEASKFEKQMKQAESGEKTGLEILKDQNKNISKFKGIPGWAKKLGAIEPSGLTLDDKLSDDTAEDIEKHMNKSFSAHYYGEPEALMVEAKKVVKALNGKINTEESDFLLANGKLDGGAYSLSVTVRTDIDKPFMSYMITGTKKF
jgi:hypothetical protein